MPEYPPRQRRIGPTVVHRELTGISPTQYPITVGPGEGHGRNSEHVGCDIYSVDLLLQLRELNADVYEAFGEASDAVYDETRQHSAFTAKVIDAYMSAQREVGGWQKIAEVGYSARRNQVLGI